MRAITTEQVALTAPTHTVRAGEKLVLEAEALWRIASGELELVGTDPSGEAHLLGRLGPGERVSAELVSGRIGARAVVDCVLSAAASSEDLSALLRRMRDQLEDRIRERHERVLVGRFLASLIRIVCLYIALLGMPKVIARLPDSAWLSVPLQALFLFETVRFIRKSGLPRAWFGLTLTGAMRALWEGGALAAVLCGALWLVDQTWPSLLAELAGGPIGWSPRTVLIAAGVYAVFSVVQELVVRGGVEACFRLSLTGRSRGMQAALLANLLFALMHLHLSWTMAVFSFVVGLAWSALYARHRTLVGVTASHLLVGLFVFFFLRAA